MAVTRIADIVVPEIFAPYVQQVTMEKTELIQAGVLVRDAQIDQFLAGGGLTFNIPSFRDLTNDDENVSSDQGADSSPKNIGTSQEVGVRLNRNQHWGTADLSADLAGEDPQEAIASRVGYYWARRLQAAFIATVQGVFADNAAAPTGTDTHTVNDMTHDISGTSYQPGVTDFSAEAVLDAAVTMGDAQTSLTMVMMHSIIYNRAQKNNLIDFIPDARGEVNIPTFLGRRVIVDDSLPNPAGNAGNGSQTAAGIYHTWLFGPAAFRLGLGAAKVPVEVERKPAANQGGGEEHLHSRVVWCIHPAGYAYVGNLTGIPGGPSNAATANNLADAGSWSRVFPERKQIKIARLITREA